MQTMGVKIWERETLCNTRVLCDFGKMKAESRCLSLKSTQRQVKITELE